MPEFLPDPEMERLVQELNRLSEGRGDAPPEDGPEALPALDAPGLRTVVSGERLAELLEEMAERGASDLLLIPGSPPVLRVDGRLQRLDDAPLDAEVVRDLFAAHLGSRSRALLAGPREGGSECQPAAADSGRRPYDSV